MKALLTPLMIMLVVLSLTAQNHLIVEELDLQRVKDKSLVYKAFAGGANLSIATGGVYRINIETGAGHVKVRQSQSRKMFIEAEIIVSAKSLSSAYSTIDDHLELALTKEGDEIFLVSRFDFDEKDGREPFGFFKAPSRKVNIAIYIPENVDIELNDRSGALEIKGVNNNMSINDTSGGVRIEGVNGNLRLVDHSGEVNIHDVNSNSSKEHFVDITDYSGQLSLFNVTGKVKISDTSGGIYIDQVFGELEIDDNSGGINVTDVEGVVDINDTSGGMVITNVVGSIEVSDTSGGIYINEVSDDVYVNRDGSGGLTVRNIGGDLKGRVRKLD